MSNVNKIIKKSAINLLALISTLLIALILSFFFLEEPLAGNPLILKIEIVMGHFITGWFPMMILGKFFPKADPLFIFCVFVIMCLSSLSLKGLMTHPENVVYLKPFIWIFGAYIGYKFPKPLKFTINKKTKE
ncbi:MAG: hypothetical protein K8R48_07145 [Alphaproteobacteria bacterium]|nr:hypothetical protein [Alphaproteobacteria bacterium]